MGGVNMEWDAIINAILSFIIPGVGQAINGYKKKGIIMFIIAVLLVLVSMFILPIIGNVIYFIFSLYSAYDAYKTY